MIYTLLATFIKKHFFVVYGDKFSSESSGTYVERYVAKHMLLKPDLIVVNDQIHGFKQLPESVKTLEKYPIFIEIEYSFFDKETKLIEIVDIYSEASVDCSQKQAEVLHLASLYKKFIHVDRLVEMSENAHESLIIHSKLPELFSEGYLEEDIEEDFLKEKELKSTIEAYLIGFVNFIKMLDDILHHDKQASSIGSILQSPIDL